MPGLQTWHAASSVPNFAYPYGYPQANVRACLKDYHRAMPAARPSHIRRPKPYAPPPGR